MRIPVPYIGHNECVLRAELTYLIYAHLILRRAVCALIAPFYVCPVDVGYQISVWRSATVHVACPPCSARRTYVVLIKFVGHYHILIEVSVSAEHVHVAPCQYGFQFFGVGYIVLLLVIVPHRSVHVYQNEHAVGHIAEVFFQPFYVGRHDSLLIFVVSLVVDVVDRYHVHLSYVERVVQRSELVAEVLLGVIQRARFQIHRSGVCLVEVVVADALESRQFVASQ